MKKIILISFIFLFFGLASHALAQGFVPLAPIPGLTQGVTANSAGLATFFNNLYKYLIGLSAALAVIMIIWGGLEISTQDSISKQGAGKEKIQNAIFGLVLVLSPVLVFSIINPNILNLSLSIPKLDTAVTTPTCPAGQVGTPPNCAPNTCPAGQVGTPPNCVNNVASGLYSSPQSGGWCYQIINCTNSTCVSTCGAGGCNYNCGNQTQCTALLAQEVRGTTVPMGASCTLYQ